MTLPQRTAQLVLPPALFGGEPLMGTRANLICKVDDGERACGLPAGMRGKPRTPDETTVWIGLDIGKTEHFADVLDEANDEAAIEALIARAESFGSPAVVDQPGSLARLVLGVAARRGVPVAYVPGLVMRRAATSTRVSPRPTAATRRAGRHRPHPAPPGALARCRQRLLEQLRVLNGYDTDLAADATRLTNRLRDALTGLSPALEHGPQGGGTGPARPLPDTAGAGHGGSRPHRADAPEALAAPRGRAHRGRHRGPRRPDRGRTRLGRDGSGDR